MPSLTETLVGSYKPTMAIVVYKDDSDYYLESHEINENGKLLAGKPLLQETIQGMVDVLFDERRNQALIEGLLPENVLHYAPAPGGKYRLIWYRPAEKKVLHFAKELKLPSEQTWVPAMLYSANGHRLNVWALDSDKRPTAKSSIYRAPFWNVSADGDVCLGNAKVKKPERTFDSILNYWESLFWLSEFTHINGDKLLNGDEKAEWTKLLKSKCRLKFDAKLLIKSKTTISKLINHDS